MKLKHLSLFIFLFVWATHFLSKTVTITDSWGVLPVSMSIIREHNTNLDEYQSLIHGKHENAIEIINGHTYYYFPIGTSIVITPVLRGLDFFCKHVIYMDINQVIANGYSGGIELFIASFIVAVTSVFIFLIAFEITQNKLQSLLAVFIFAFCTSAWSVASRALWSHTCSMLMLSIALFSLLRAQQNAKYLFITGLALGYAYVVRPTNSLSIIFFSIFVLLNYRKYIPVYIIGLLLIAVPFIAYNYHIYHGPLSTYYLPARLQERGSNLTNALPANLISPGRGLFIFSPVLLFSISGIIILIRDRKFSLLSTAILFIIIFHYYIISSIKTPFAGWSFGQRFFCDLMPFFIYFLIFFIKYLVQMDKGPVKISLSVLLAITIAISFFINYRGANRPATFMWNGTPNNIDEHPERIWDWHDLQFMR